MYNLFTFNNTHSAIYMEKCAGEAGIPVKVLPVPVAISADCGLAIRIESGLLDKAIQVMEEAEIDCAGVYAIDSQGKITEVEK